MRHSNGWHATPDDSSPETNARHTTDHADHTDHTGERDERDGPKLTAAAPALPHLDPFDPGDTQPSLPAPRTVPVFTPAIRPIQPHSPLPVSGPLDNPAHGLPTAPSPSDSIWRPRLTRAGTKLLIVENEYANLQLMERILGYAGYECFTASNGREALAIFERERPDLILTDIAMPVMDGLAATAALRARPEGARIPIVAVSAHVMAEDRERALRAGCTEYVTKPYRPHDLLAVVERLLTEGRR